LFNNHAQLGHSKLDFKERKFMPKFRLGCKW